MQKKKHHFLRCSLGKYCWLFKSCWVGNVVEISGTTAVDGDTIVGKGNVYKQAVFILEKIEKTLQRGRKQSGRCSKNKNVCYRYFSMEGSSQSACTFL